MGQVSSIVRNAMKIVGEFVHPEHWIYRSLLMVLFMHCEGVADQMFAMVAQHGFDVLEMAGRLGSVDHENYAEENGGGIILHMFRDFWRRIEPFYPREQGYRVHSSIVRIAIINLIAGYNKKSLESDLAGTPYCPMSFEKAAEVLEAHAGDLPKTETKGFLRFIQGAAGKNLPDEDLAKLTTILA